MAGKILSYLVKSGMEYPILQRMFNYITSKHTTNEAVMVTIDYKFGRI